MEGPFSSIIFFTSQQMTYTKEIKEKSDQSDTVIVQMDFAENFDLTTQHAIQSVHWGQRQATIFIVHIKVGRIHYNLAIVSDHMHHDSSFVGASQELIVNFVKDKCPGVRKLNYLSDGGPAHFKITTRASI